jgi:hypothetical protein
VRAGLFAEAPHEDVALSLWGVAHGLVSLEINGSLPPGVDVAPVYERAIRAQADGWRR